MYSYSSQEGIDVRVARIFNTYGTRMNLADGRVISNFITQALRGDPITVTTINAGDYITKKHAFERHLDQ